MSSISLPLGVSPSVATLAEYMHRVGYAPGTVEGRIRRLQSLGVPPEEATREDVLRALPLAAKPSTKRVYVSSLSSSFRDLITLGICETNPAAGVRVPGFHRGMPRPLPPAVYDALLAAPSCPEQDWTVLGAFAGYRASDVAALWVEDLVMSERGWVLVVEGKGGFLARVPAHERVVEVIQRRAQTQRAALWRVTSHSVSTRWKHWALGVTGQVMRFHQCRHTFGTRVYAASGADLLTTRDLLRHRSVVSTQIYAGVDPAPAFAAVAGL